MVIRTSSVVMKTFSRLWRVTEKCLEAEPLQNFVLRIVPPQYRRLKTADVLQ
jgi:hypothetical protein